MTRCGGGYSRPEVRVHATGPLPSVPLAGEMIAEEDGSWRVMVADGAAPTDVLRALVTAGACIDRFEPVLAPMDDIFLRVVREERA